MDADTILANIRSLADEFARDRHARQLRRELDAADFDRLRDAGFLLAPVPRKHGGVWEDGVRSTRPLAEMLRILASADSSLALVAAMHPAVLGFAGWLGVDEAPEPYAAAWAAQRAWAFGAACEGHWWGTVTSEPGSGGDVMQTRATARRGDDGAYSLSGTKHFGSGAGIASYMVTSAVAEGETVPDVFFIDMRGVSWDGSGGITMTAAWDGHGMPATQSHAFAFSDVPARRVAWPDFQARRAQSRGTALFPALFTAVVAGIAGVALDSARRQLEPRHASLRPYEQVEWTRAEIDGWLIAQAYEGILRAAEQDDGRAVLIAKTAIAELAESLLRRLCRLLGGGTYSRQSPFGFWFEDVRALGFLRPPWALAYDNIFAAS